MATDNSTTQSDERAGGSDSDQSFLSKISLKPAYKKDNPNPHAHSRGIGRSHLPTPSTIAGSIWRKLGVESHVALTVFLLPLLSLIVYLHVAGLEIQWLGIFVGSVVLSYTIYYSQAPRESKHVIARLSNIYNAGQFALVSSGIAGISIISSLLVVTLFVAEEYLPVRTADTSVTIATVGIAVGLLSSYVLVRVLVARALPVRSNKPYIERLVESNPLIEYSFILAAIGAPAFIFSAQFFWDRPELISFNIALSRDAAGILISGFTCIYAALITRL